LSNLVQTTDEVETREQSLMAEAISERVNSSPHSKALHERAPLVAEVSGLAASTLAAGLQRFD
jgi:hypothetical protein